MNKVFIPILFLFPVFNVCHQLCASHMVDPTYLPGVQAMSSKRAERRSQINLSHCAPRAIFMPSYLKGAEVYHGIRGFSVHEGSSLYSLDYHDQDSMARKIDMKNLLAFLNMGGKISISRASDGSFIMRTHMGAPGGGPIMANIMYYGTFLLGGALPLVVPYVVLNSSFTRDFARQTYEASLSATSFLDSQAAQASIAQAAISAKAAAEAAEGAIRAAEQVVPALAAGVMDQGGAPVDLQIPRPPIAVDGTSAVRSLSTLVVDRRARNSVKDIQHAAESLYALTYVIKSHGAVAGTIACYGVAAVTLGVERSKFMAEWYWNKINSVADAAYAKGRDMNGI